MTNIALESDAAKSAMPLKTIDLQHCLTTGQKTDIQMQSHLFWPRMLSAQGGLKIEASRC